MARSFFLFQMGIGHDVKLDLTPLWLKRQTLKGVYGCGVAEYKGRQRHMFDIAISLIQEGNVNLEGMASHALSLKDYDKLSEENLNKEKYKAVKSDV